MEYFNGRERYPVQELEQWIPAIQSEPRKKGFLNRALQWERKVSGFRSNRTYKGTSIEGYQGQKEVPLLNTRAIQIGSLTHS